MMRFDKFTERAQDAIARAQEIMTRYKHNQLDVEHMLLALLEQPEGVITQVLNALQADADHIRRRTDDALQATPKTYFAPQSAGGAQIFVTPRLKRVIDAAEEEARRMNDEFVSTEHIFLAILSERDGQAPAILRESNVAKDKAIEAIRKHKSAYLMAVGGAAYLVSKAIKAARVVGFADLGMEAIYEFTVQDMPVSRVPRASIAAWRSTGAT